MKLLVLGGTVFLGRHVVESALARGHEVSLFNRGQSNPGLFPDAEHLVGDRNGNLNALENREWDAVLDMCGYVPRIVRASAEALQGSGRYVFISTISVYADPSKQGLTEEDAVGTLEDRSTEEIGGGSYGPLKALCEDAVRDVFGDRALIIRPGLIVGPDDKTDRFTYWPVRLAEGGEVLVPDRFDQPTQFIDVRDLAVWVVDMAETGEFGTYNATGPVGSMTFGELLTRCVSAVGKEVVLVKESGEFLESNEVEPWSDLPLVLPYDGSGDGMGTIDIRRAVGKGLTFRPIEETAVDTLAWFRAYRESGSLRAGLGRDRERELLSIVPAAT